MKKHIIAMALLPLLGAVAVDAGPITYTATLLGANENPPNDSLGTGVATVVYDPLLHTLKVDASFQDLVGITTASHIHCCTDPPGNVGVASQTPSFIGFPLGVTSGTFSALFDLTLPSSWNPAFVTAQGGIEKAEAALAAALDAGRAYFNIHTTFRSGGEIRGFFARAPEPATLGLIAIGMGAVAFARRKRNDG